MEFKINFIFGICIVIAFMFTFSVVFAVIDSIKQIKQEKASKEKGDKSMQGYKAYVLLDFDDVNFAFILEVYDFRNDYFEVKEFECYSDFINYFHDELCSFLQVEESDILQVVSRSFQKKMDLIKK